MSQSGKSETYDRADSVLQLGEATLRDLHHALEQGMLTSAELVALYLNRIAYFDRHGICLNAVPVLNRDMFEEAGRSDERRALGKALGPLDGIPYIAKASFAVAGLPVAAGSPAFEHLVAREDSFAIARLRAAGAILIGLTNMPPMAAGGMQRGVYGRAESPYNGNFLTSAYASGSSNGSGTGVAANFAAFGLAEETWSSGRAPASYNALAAYTPSRGVISIRGNWPLIPTMDVVVPYARCMDDLLEILNVLVADDRDSRGDFWRQQKAAVIPKSSQVRPADYLTLRDRSALSGKRIGIPRMYINKDPDCARPIETRRSILDLWALAERDLKALGAEVVEVDFPVVSNYEKDRPGTQSLVERGLLPRNFAQVEGLDLMIFAWDDYLRANADPKLNRLADVDEALIFPSIPGALPDLYEGIPAFREFPGIARRGVRPKIPHLDEGIRGLEKARRVDLEEWMDQLRLDAVAFPAVADVGPADSDYNALSQKAAWRNGVWVANGNQAIRHLGIPTVTTCMGIMADTAMPVGITFAGRAYEDNKLLAFAYAFEASRQRREPPGRTEALPEESLRPDGKSTRGAQPAFSAEKLAWDAAVLPVGTDGRFTIRVDGEIADRGAGDLRLFVNGRPLSVKWVRGRFSGQIKLPMDTHTRLHSRWRGPYGSIVVALYTSSTGHCVGDYKVVGGIE